MSPEQVFVIAIAVVVSAACSMLGVFLILRRVSLMSDAISHAILLGIVLGFFAFSDLHSPFLIISAALAGVLTVTLTELLIKTKKVKEDASIGLVFPFLFAIAVVLLTKFASNVHLDTDAVIKGSLLLAVFDKTTIFGMQLPSSLVVMTVILLLNAVFITFFYKELKIAVFDRALALSLGLAPGWIYYGLMTLVSITAVGAFDAVGSILVVALMIVPPATAYLLTHRLGMMLFLSIIMGVGSALSGYWLASLLDASIAGCMASMTGLFFALALLFSPKRGLVYQWLSHKKKSLLFSAHLLLVHLLDHEGKPEAKRENTINNAVTHMGWSQEFTQQIVTYALSMQWISQQKNSLWLTPLGRTVAKEVMTHT